MCFVCLQSTCSRSSSSVYSVERHLFGDLPAGRHYQLHFDTMAGLRIATILNPIYIEYALLLTKNMFTPFWSFYQPGGTTVRTFTLCKLSLLVGVLGFIDLTQMCFDES